MSEGEVGRPRQRPTPVAGRGTARTQRARVWCPATRIYLAADATDMRKGFGGHYGLARYRLSCDPPSGHIFLFTNALWVEVLEKGRFRWPEAEGSQRKVVLNHEELALLVA